jgi:hypothetical protein
MTAGQNQMHQQHPLLHEPVPAPTPWQYFAHCVVVVHAPFANGSLHAVAGRTSARSDAAPNTSAAPTPALNSVVRTAFSLFDIYISGSRAGAPAGCRRVWRTALYRCAGSCITGAAVSGRTCDAHQQRQAPVPGSQLECALPRDEQYWVHSSAESRMMLRETSARAADAPEPRAARTPTAKMTVRMRVLTLAMRSSGKPKGDRMHRPRSRVVPAVSGQAGQSAQLQ